MKTPYEKQLERRIAVLERGMAEVFARVGIEGEALRAYKFDEAIDGGPEMIKAYLREVNGSRA